MKKINYSRSKLVSIMFCLTGIFNIDKASGQDVVNVYKQTPLSITELFLDNTASSYQHNFIFNSNYYRDYNNHQTFNSVNYTGEYEICLLLHPWYYLFLDPVLRVPVNHPPVIFAISYNYEVVSYPFQIDCPFSSGLCIESGPCSTHVRNLYMPIEGLNNFTYNSFDNSYTYYSPPGSLYPPKLYLKTPIYDFFSIFSSGNLGQFPHPAQSLISGGFTLNS